MSAAVCASVALGFFPLESLVDVDGGCVCEPEERVIREDSSHAIGLHVEIFKAKEKFTPPDDRCINNQETPNGDCHEW